MNRVLAAFFIVLLVSSAISGFVFWSMGKPWFWKRAIRRFEKSDLAHPPKPGVIVFTGSSSVNFWKGLSHDMAPLNVLNRGFGGSQMAHVVYYASRIVLPYFPRSVVVYAGENDLAWPWSKSPETVLRDFQEFVDLVQRQLPTAWIYLISIKPTPRRWKLWEKQRRTNQMIEDFCRAKPQVQFVDVASEMLSSTGKPRRDLFKGDGLHPSKECYALWTSILRPILIKRFAATEIASSATNRSDSGEKGCAGNSV
jgi:lysophospholipase L1-like esterase